MFNWIKTEKLFFLIFTLVQFYFITKNEKESETIKIYEIEYNKMWQKNWTPTG